MMSQTESPVIWETQSKAASNEMVGSGRRVMAAGSAGIELLQSAMFNTPDLIFRACNIR